MINFPTQLDDKGQILRLLGGFWEEVYTGNDYLAEALKGRCNLTKQTFERLQEAIDCRSRLDIPVFRKEYWLELTMKKSVIAGLANNYGEESYYGTTAASYGRRSSGFSFFYPLPEEIVDCPIITNRISSPSTVLFRNLDFYIDSANHRLFFAENPFNNDSFAHQTTEGDEEIVLWLQLPRIDKEYLYSHFGYVIGLWAKSSQPYKDLLNNVYDSMVLGTSMGKTLDGIAATTGIPLAKGNETVEDITYDRNNLLVITNKNVYKFNKNSQAVVSIGDSLRVDQEMTDGILVHEFNRGEVPESLKGLNLSKRYMGIQYIGDIGFNNEEVPVDFEYDSNGKAKMSFYLGGHPFDVEAFWDDTHKRGLAMAMTLADAFDNRPVKYGEPGPTNVPSVINPLKFLAENVLRNGAFLVKIKAGSVRPGFAGIENITYLRNLIPPHTTMFLLIDLQDIEEEVLQADYEDTEEIGSFTGMGTTFETEITTTDVSDTIVARVVRGNLL